MASSWKPDASDPDLRTGDFWVTHPQMRPDENGESRNGANAYLENVKGQRVWLWVNDITSDFAMSGETAQSRNRREFFAHNFAQPSMTVNCQTPNSYEYNRLGEFIRDSHQKGFANQGHVLKFKLAPSGYGPHRTAKGIHSGIFVEGHILNASRGAERWVNAPDFQFSFAISKATQFLHLNDEYVYANKLRTIMGIINDPKLNWEWEDGKPPKSGKKERDTSHEFHNPFAGHNPFPDINDPFEPPAVGDGPNEIQPVPGIPTE